MDKTAPNGEATMRLHIEDVPDIATVTLPLIAVGLVALVGVFLALDRFAV